jgi:hypothetical protein
MNRNHLFRLIVLLFSVPLISCTTKNIYHEELLKPHELLVIPYKAAPVKILTDSPAGWLALALVLNPLIVEEIKAEANKSDVEIAAELLEKLRGEWNPSTALANECSEVIKNNQKAKINTITIAITRELPGVEELRLSDPNVFSKSSGGTNDWARFSGLKWIPNDSPTIPYKLEYPQNTADWALEIFVSSMSLRDESMVLVLAIKMFNINTGERIAAADTFGKFDRTPIKDELGFKQFEKEFGGAAKQLCNSALNKIGLIGIAEK